MIIRIVKMTFQPDKVNEFLEIFASSKDKIRNSPGCNHLELLQDRSDPSVFFTYSRWNSESDLNNYRNSELFGKVWKSTKKLFLKDAKAWSLDQF